MYRAVVFWLFQKTVILPPNPVGFRLTYTQLWDIYFIQYVLQGFCSTNKPISIH